MSRLQTFGVVFQKARLSRIATTGTSIDEMIPPEETDRVAAYFCFANLTNRFSVRGTITDLGEATSCAASISVKFQIYVDPYRGRAEWKGFTPIVNKALSAKYDVPAENAPELIKALPWGKYLELMCFASILLLWRSPSLLWEVR